MNKGSFSFVAMLVVNPIVILFYQNCSMTPVSHAKNESPPAMTRSVASAEPVKTVASASDVDDVFTPGCQDSQKNCLKAK